MMRAACLCCLLIVLNAPVFGQEDTGAVADSLLRAGIAEFEAGNHAAAQSDFDQILQSRATSTSLSTATFMSARSAYRLKQYVRAASLLRSFEAHFPGSRFTASARRLLEMSEEAQLLSSVRPARLGVILSLDEQDVLQSQEMFNGIHLAVNAHNARNTRRPVQMLFRDVDGGPEVVRRAVRDLASEGVDVILGTLYSDKAMAAAQEAERQGVVFMAPMATDEAVSRGRRMTFQANPSMEVRGRLAARYAVNGLRLDSLGVVAAMDPDGLSERITDAFIQEASALGARINLIVLLPEEKNWLELTQFFPADTLDHVDALFMPIVSPERQRVAGGVLSSMDQFGKDTRIIGNSSWHDLPMRAHASRYSVTYVNDYHSGIDPDKTTLFKQDFVDLAEIPPSRLAFAGYDTALYLAGLLDTFDGAEMADAIREAPAYEGLGHRIHFDGQNINQGLYYHRYQNGQLTLQR